MSECRLAAGLASGVCSLCRITGEASADPITVAGTPDRGELITQATELVRLARRHGYRLDELLKIIEEVA